MGACEEKQGSPALPPGTQLIHLEEMLAVPAPRSEGPHPSLGDN